LKNVAYITLSCLDECKATMDTPPATPESVTPPTLSYGQRLIVVSNRLPVTLKQNDEGKYEFNESSGGLASGMSGVKRDVEMLWYGWPGMELPPSEEADITRTLREKHSAVPVPVNDDLAELYYNGFSSRPNVTNKCKVQLLI
jgi:trehalose 6-phosphate synthase